jgi:tRNA nucleotidyltransferase (CCA-adding enzyme)
MQTYLVGGAVRDTLMGLAVKDRDWVVVGATPQQMLDAGYVAVGQDFPVFLHPQTKEEYALARTERKTAPGYKGFAVHCAPEVTLEEDLGRRDLTINSIAAYADATGTNSPFDSQNLCDPYGGQRDIAAKVLRHTTHAFVEDPVRILRLARFAARFADFTVAPETLLLMQSMVQAGEVDHLVPERVWQELAKGLMEAKPSRVFAVLRDCGALAKLLPELDTNTQAMAVLDIAALAAAPLPVRFALLCTPIDANTQRVALCQRLRVPTECTELALVVAREHGNIHRSATLGADAVVGLLERCDAIRKPDRFAQITLACECDARGRLGLGESPYPQAARLKQALKAALSVATNSIAAYAISTGAKGPKIGEFVREARVAAVQESGLHADY